MTQRLDVWLVEHNQFPSRERAQAAIMAGRVLVNGKTIDKSGYGVSENDQIEVKGDDMPYVSRGGLKLAKALECFGITVQGKICLDIGASTGGFTDCLLKHGAAKVFAVDVGYGQLDWSLRTDPRVVVMERTNARYLTPEQLNSVAELATVDVSFISLRVVLPALLPLVSENADLVTLIKPQFEAGRERVGKKGVVRSQMIHYDVLKEVLAAVGNIGLACHGLSYSPVKGPEGNIEFLAHWRRKGYEDIAPVDPVQVVDEAYKALNSSPEH